MTLSTNVFIQGPVDPRAVFFKCRDLLGANDSHPWTDETSRAYPGDRLISNEIGIGLPALLMQRYRIDEPLRAEPEGHDAGWCEEDCTYPHEPAHWINVDFDTAYSYKDSYGGCGALHARLVFELGTWLDEQGVPWSWRNEFTSEIHRGEERYRRLGDLTEGGQAAMRWFKGTVEPAIQAAYGEIR